MSNHISAAPGEIAETVLIAGDPLRARYVAEKMMTEVRCYTEIRGMLGYTGIYNGKRVSVQGTGIGIPSTAIYVQELIHGYGVKKIIRIGTCGALQPDLPLDQLILATEAYTDSHTHLLYYKDANVAARPDSTLLAKAGEIAYQQGISVVKGSVFSTDMFYHEDPDRWDHWKRCGVLAVEMESSVLYGLALKNHIQALTILTVSDNIMTGTSLSAQNREEASGSMMELAMEIA